MTKEERRKELRRLERERRKKLTPEERAAEDLRWKKMKDEVCRILADMQ